MERRGAQSPILEPDGAVVFLKVSITSHQILLIAPIFT